MKIFTRTFGCQMNFADSDEMGRHFNERGFTAAENEESADAILVNTCTVRDLAEHKASSFIGRLKDWKDAHPQGLVIVTGCAAERAKDDFKRRFPHIDLIVGAKDIEQFPAELNDLLARHSRKSGNPGLKPDFKEIELNSGFPAHSTRSHNTGTAPAYMNLDGTVPIGTFGNDGGGKVIQYVTIMRGCNYNCSYCIVPAVRGREVYRPVDEILADVGARSKEGAKEIWLLGQTVNSYKPAQPPREGYDFADLLDDVCRVPGTERIRFISPHPYYLSDKLIASMTSNKKVCEHIHLPVQSGSDEMLKKMKRNYTRAVYVRGLAKLRQAIPNIAISTDIIVGFPGETENDYNETLSLVEEAGFDSAYCFKYSPRPGTASAAWVDDVPEPLKEERVNRLLEITEAQGQKKAAALIGSTQEILIEDDKGEGVFRGKTRGAWRARLRQTAATPGTLRLGTLIKARITDTHSRELHAELI